MAYTVCERVFIGALGLLFCLVALTTTALILMVSYWYKNQKDRRCRDHKKEQAKVIERADADREQWQALLGERDQQINRLLDQLAILTSALDRTKKLLEASEKERAKA